MQTKEILTKTWRYTGFQQLPTHKFAAELTTVGKDDTPFLHDKIAGREVWRTSWSSMLQLRHARGERDSYHRYFQVYHDAGTGQLLKAWSTFDGEDADLLAEPRAAHAEDQLRKSGEEYRGLPLVEPKVDLLEALSLIYAKGIGNPYTAKEIQALYVLHSRMSSPGRPCWVITLRGIPPLTPRGVRLEQDGEANVPDVPVWQRNHIRNVVDGETGDVLFANNLPQPH